MKNVKLVGFSIIVILLGTIIVMVFENKGGGVDLFKKMVNSDKSTQEVSLNPSAVGGELGDSSGEVKPLPTSKVILDASKANFEETGNLTGKNLVYEEPGKPAISVELIFNGTSWCEDKPCLIGSNLSMVGRYPDGTRVRITGEKEGDKVTVYVLKLVK